MKTWFAVLQSVDVDLRSLEINLAPLQLNCFADAQTVTVASQHQGVIPHRSA
jgi:hypothetical protein